MPEPLYVLRNARHKTAVWKGAMWPGGLEGGGMNFVLANGVGAAVLLFTAAAKLARPRDSRDALGSYGLAAGRQRVVQTFLP